MNTGALQLVPVRQLMTPLPYSPPTTNAPFLIDGITMTHCALFQRSSGMPLSAEPRSSSRMAPASESRFASSFVSAEKAARRNRLNDFRAKRHVLYDSAEVSWH